MALWRRQKNSGSTSVGADPVDDSYDPTAGDPTARQLRAGLDAGDWRGVTAFLADLPPGPSRSFYIDQCSDRPDLPPWLDEWVAMRPDDSLPYLLRGATAIRWAWVARGSGQADTVSRDAFGTFWERLRGAERDLAVAMRLAPDDADPIAFSMTSARGLQVDGDELQRRLDALMARDRQHHFGLAQFGRTIQDKWSGSHEAMFSFARQVVAAVPDGSTLLALLPEAHAERQYNHIWAGEIDEANAYFEDESVRGELREAERRFSAAEVPGNPWNASAHCLFGYCAAQMDDAPLTLHHLSKLERPLFMPFGYSASPGGHFGRLKAWATEAVAYDEQSA